MPHAIEDSIPAAASGETQTPRQRSNANLRPWPRGVSGNPSGRPRRKRGVWVRVDSVDGLLAAVMALIEEEDG